MMKRATVAPVDTKAEKLPIEPRAEIPWNIASTSTHVETVFALRIGPSYSILSLTDSANLYAFFMKKIFNLGCFQDLSH